MRASAFVFFIILYSCSAPYQPETGDWPMYSADNAGSKYSTLLQIDRSNVHQLKLAWKYSTGDMRESPRTQIQCNPIIVNGRMFLITPGLKVVALEAANGKELWKFDPYKGVEASGTIRGLAHFSDESGDRILYIAGSDLYCLDAQNGQIVESFGNDGKVDLTRGLERDVEGLWVTATTPGIVYKDLYILGSRVSEGPGPAAPGHIRAYDLKTGEIRWIFHTIPHPGEVGYETWPKDAWKFIGGANSWGGFTLDEKRGLVFCGTGCASYDHWGGNRHGDNLFANCILALDAETGERLWHYQTVHHDIWDYDLPCPPNLVQVKKEGMLIDAVAQPTKMGHLFVLDRVTGEPIFPITEKEVPQSDIPGERTSRTQPFPPPSLRYGQQRLTEDEATTLSESANDFVREKLSGMITGDVFLPPSKTPVVTMPQFNGGTDWGGAAYDPKERMLYVNCSNEAEWISMVPFVAEKGVVEYDFGYRRYRSYCESCHGRQEAYQPNSPGLNSLRKLGRDTARLFILKTLKSGKGQMPAFTSLSDIEKEAITSFILNEGKDNLLDYEQINTDNSKHIPWISTGHRVIKTPDGFPINKRPWGTLTAIHLDQGNIAWQKPLGTYPKLEVQGHPSTGTFNMGGPVVTAGGLVFIAASMDERIHAYDKFTGELLWEFQMDAGGYATPSTYEVDGKQYVVIAGGGGGKPGTKAGDAYYCFALAD